MPQNNKNINIEHTDKTAPPTGYWRSFLNWGEWLNLVFLFLAVGTAMWSVEQARWLKPSPSFIVIFAIALLFSYFLSKSRLHPIAAHILILVGGLIVVFWQGLSMLPEPGLASKMEHFVGDIQAWWHAERYGAPIPVTIHIALMFGYISWLIGYFSTWFLIKRRNPWIAVFLGAVVVLVNLNFWVSQKYYFFLIYIIAALLLIAVATFTRHRSQLAKSKTSRSGWGPASWIATSLSVIIITVFIAWTNPGYRIDAIADYAKANSPFKGNSMQLYWQNFFATVPGSGAPVLVHGGQQNILFGGSLELNDQVVFFINANQPNYWKTQIYDYYDSSGWQTSPTTEKAVEKNATGAGTPTTPVNTLNITIIPQVKTNVLPIVGEYTSGDIPVIEKKLNPQLFEINLLDAAADALLPQDIASVAKSIRAIRLNRRFNETQITALVPAGLKLVSVNRSGSTIQSVSISRDQSESNTIVALSATQIMLPQQQATITLQTNPGVTEETINAAGTNYPQNVTDRYLQLPSTLPARVRELAQSVTRGADTPYSKAKAIKEYLAQYQYSLTINAPPANADGVDYFLFTQKSGYCTYFASAMTVMLRSAGIPARLVSGFLPGQFDPEMQNYVIRDRDYHAWTEVYFPGYGWLIIDATPSNAVTQSADTGATIQDVPPPNQSAIPDYSIDTSSLTTDRGNFTIPIVSGLMGVLLILLLLTWLRIYRKAASIPAIYSRMVLLASLAGLGPKPWQTALEFSRQLSTAIPQHAPVIDQITRTYVISRYSNQPLEMAPDEPLRHSWPKLRQALVKRFFRIK